MADLSHITLPSGTTYDLKDEYLRSEWSDYQGGETLRGVSLLSISGSSASLDDSFNSAMAKYTNAYAPGRIAQMVADGVGYDWVPVYANANTITVKLIRADATNVYAVELTAASTDSSPMLGTYTVVPINDVTDTYSASSHSAMSGVAVANAIASAMVGAAAFQGVVNANSTISGAAYKKGMYWVVGTAGTYVGVTCEVGDFIFAIADKGASYSANDFSVVQANIDMSVFGDLAYKDTASAAYTPAGTVSQPTFTGTQGNISVSGTLPNSVSLSTAVPPAPTPGVADVTPAGTVSQPTFTGTEGNVSVSGTATGSVSTVYNGTASGASGNFTPEGTVSQPTFTGTEFSSTGTFTPAGTVSKPNVTVTPSTGTVNSITNVGTLPELTMTVTNETLTFSWSAGTLPTKGSDQTVLTGVSAALAAAPSFTGTQGTVSVSGTATGTVSQPTFTGTKKYAHHTFSGSSFNSTGTFTPSGTVSQPTFTGSTKYVSATVGTASKTLTGTFTPEGTVSKPSFSGTQATIEVS